MALGKCKKIADARYFWCMAIVLVPKLPLSFDDCDRLFLRLSGDFVVTMGYGGYVKTLQLFGIQYSPAF